MNLGFWENVGLYPVKKYNVLGDFRDSVLVLPLFSPIVDIILDKRLEIFRLLFVSDLWKMGTMEGGGIKLFFYRV